MYSKFFVIGPTESGSGLCDSYQPAMISTYFMAVGDRPGRSAAQRDAVPSGKRRDAAGRSPTATGGRDKFATGGVAARLWCTHPQIDSWGANRSCPVANFSPVK